MSLNDDVLGQCLEPISTGLTTVMVTCPVNDSIPRGCVKPREDVFDRPVFDRGNKLPPPGLRLSFPRGFAQPLQLLFQLLQPGAKQSC
jgi:hypothetical protein